jgi:putative lipoprotein
MPKFSLLLAQAAILSVAPGCAQAPGGAGAPSILGEWAVTEIDGVAVPADAAVTATFGSDGKVGGVSGCNHYGGDYVYKKGVVTIRAVYMTEMACLDEGRMDLETKFHNRFAGALAVAAAPDGSLALSDEDGRLVLRRAGA